MNKSDDTISRQDAIDALGEEPEIWNDTEEEWAYRNSWVEHISAIKSLPSATSQSLTKPNKSCEDDLIRRRDAVNAVLEITMYQGRVPVDTVMYRISNIPSADRPKNMIHIDDVYRLIAGHSDYHGDSILSAFTCLVEGKDVKPIAPLNESADRPTGEWVSEELANMICNEICYYKEVTVDADSLNDLCEGCLIKKMKYCRPTGDWVFGYDDETKEKDLYAWTCSLCGGKYPWQPNYCPNCGAKMRGEEE